MANPPGLMSQITFALYQSTTPPATGWFTLRVAAVWQLGGMAVPPKNADVK